MELFTVQCETCAARLKVRDLAAIGDILECPKCGSFVQVAAPPGWTPPAVLPPAVDASSSTGKSGARSREAKPDRADAKPPRDAVTPLSRGDDSQVRPAGAVKSLADHHQSPTKRGAPPPLPEAIPAAPPRELPAANIPAAVSSADLGHPADAGLDLTDDRSLSAKARQATSGVGKRIPPPLPGARAATLNENAAALGDDNDGFDFAVSPVESAARKWLMFGVGAATALLVVFALWNTFGKEDGSAAAEGDDKDTVEAKTEGKTASTPPDGSPSPPNGGSNTTPSQADPTPAARIEPRVPAGTSAAIRLVGKDERVWSWPRRIPVLGETIGTALDTLCQDFGLPPDKVRSFACALPSVQDSAGNVLVVLELTDPLPDDSPLTRQAQLLPDVLAGSPVYQRPQGAWKAPYFKLDDRTILAGPLELLRAAVEPALEESPQFSELSPTAEFAENGNIGLSLDAAALAAATSDLDCPALDWIDPPSAEDFQRHALRNAVKGRLKVYFEYPPGTFADDTLANPVPDIHASLQVEYSHEVSAAAAETWAANSLASMRKKVEESFQRLDEARNAKRLSDESLEAVKNVLVSAKVSLDLMKLLPRDGRTIAMQWQAWHVNLIEVADHEKSGEFAQQLAALSTDPPPVPDPDPPMPIPMPRVEVPPAAKIDVAARLEDKLPAIDLPPLPLADFAEFISRLSTIPITFDLEAMSRIGVTPEVEVSVKRKDSTVGAVLTAVLGERGLKYQVAPGGLVITAASSAGALVTERHAVDDLAGKGDNAMSEFAALTKRLVAAASWHDDDSAASDAPGKLAIDGTEFVVEQSLDVQHELQRFFDRLRVARGRPPRKLPPDQARLETPLAQAGELLRKPVTANFRQPTSLARITEYLGQKTGANLFIDGLALRSAGLSADAKVEFVAAETPLGDALDQLCRPLDLAFRLVDGQNVQITSRAAAAAEFQVEFYPLADLVPRAEDFPPLFDRLQRSSPEAWQQEGRGAYHFDAPSKTLIVAQPQDVQMRLEHAIAALRAERTAGEEPATP